MPSYCPAGPPRSGAARRRRRPGRATSSACGPRWTIRPRSTTTTSSADSAVDIRCAMVTDVRPVISRSRARPIRISSCGSTALVASSRTSRSGSARWARSSATSWRSPAESDSPRWPTWVSRPAGSVASQSPRPSSAGAGADVVLGGVELAVADVGGDGVVEEEPLLRHQHDAAAQRRLGDPAYVDAVEQDRALDRVHQPGEQLGDRRLARAGLADDRDPAAGVDVEVDVLEHQRPARVGERHVVEADVDRAARQHLAVGARVDQVGRGLEDADDPAPAGDGVLGVGEDLGAHLHRADEQRHEEGEGQHGAGGHVGR